MQGFLLINFKGNKNNNEILIIHISLLYSMLNSLFSSELILHLNKHNVLTISDLRDPGRHASMCMYMCTCEKN